MTRRLLHLVTALSLPLCAALAGITAYSFWNEHRFDWGRRGVAGNRSVDVRWTVSLGWGEVEVERRSSTVTHVSEQRARQLGARYPSGSDFSHRSRRASAPAARDGTVWRRLGFFWYHVSGSYPFFPSAGPGSTAAVGFDELQASAPVWPALLCALPPGFWLIRCARRFQARRNARRGLCPSCGYDLTGNVSGVCPECGRAAPRSEAAP